MWGNIFGNDTFSFNNISDDLENSSSELLTVQVLR